MPDDSRTVAAGDDSCRMEFDLDAGTYSVLAHEVEIFNRARPRVFERVGSSLAEIVPAIPWEVRTSGPGGFRVEAGSGRGTVSFEVEAMDGALILSVSLAPADGESVELEIMSPLVVPEGGIWPGRTSNKSWRFYLNGWQCWTPAAALKRKRTGDYLLPQFFPRPLKPMLINTATPVPSEKGSFDGEWFGGLADVDRGDSVVLGFTGVEHALSQVSVALGRSPEQSRMEASARYEGKTVKAGEVLASEKLAVIPGDLSGRNLEKYADMTAAAQGVERTRRSPAGWCSWYQFFTDLKREDVDRNLSLASGEFAGLGLDLIQVDDGYQPFVGQWLETNERFPGGMREVAEAIAERGKIPGIWVAPLTVLRKSKMFSDRREWLIKKGRRGRPVMAGISPDWDGRFYGLDPTHPGVLEYIEEVFGTLREWGYRFFKLDFLACGMLEGSRYDPSLTRAEGLRQALRVARKAAGDDAWIIAAGGPLMLGVGIFDTQRTGADVAPVWRTKFQVLMRDRSTPGARNCIIDSMTRAFMNGRLFEADPDCLLLRGRDTKLSWPERQSLSSCASLLGGAFIISDDLSLWGGGEAATAAKLLPHLPAKPRTPDLWKREVPRYMVSNLEDPCGVYSVAMVINWMSRTKKVEVRLSDLGMEPGWYHAHEFWTDTYLGEIRDSFECEIQGHGPAVVRLTPVGDSPRIVGSNVHLTQGAAEIRRFTTEGDRLSMTVSCPVKSRASIVLFVPGGSAAAAPHGREVTVERLGKRAFRIIFEVEGETDIDLEWRH